jgi:ureidoacrylate peracid hydrolase
VIYKHTYDAFWSTDIHAHLQKHGIKRLFFSGCLTKACVMFTANSAFSHGYDVYILDDCCADRSKADHDAVLQAYNGYHIKVINSSDIAKH